MAAALANCVHTVQHTFAAAFFTLSSLADDAQSNGCGQYGKQLCRPAEHLVNFIAHACCANKFVYSDVRIYTLNDVSESGITPKAIPDQYKP